MINLIIFLVSLNISVFGSDSDAVSTDSGTETSIPANSDGANQNNVVVTDVGGV